MVRAAARARRVAGDGEPRRNLRGSERVLPGPSLSRCRDEAGRSWSRMPRGAAVTPPSPACMRAAPAGRCLGTTLAALDARPARSGGAAGPRSAHEPHTLAARWSRPQRAPGGAEHVESTALMMALGGTNAP